MEGYSRDKLLCGIRENAKSLNGIRDLTATREEGLTGCGIGKQNGIMWMFGIRDSRKEAAPPSYPE